MVELVPMTDSEYHSYYKEAVANYAAEHVKSGNWTPEEAPGNSRTEFEGLLPEGTTSKDQHLFTIQDTETGARVGMLWFAIRRNPKGPFAFIYDFNIYPEFQRKGYATQALRALEAKVKSMNLDEIELHVFGHNHAARSLYEKAGYEATNIRMVKQLS